jgi:predicted phage terminase large subunit-like protein
LNHLSPASEAPEQVAEVDLKAIRAHAEHSLYFFAKGILGFDWLVPHIHGPVCLMLEDRTKRRKKFVLPRGWLKTTVCTQAYPIWRAVHDPNLRVLLAQNNQDNARKKLKVIRESFETNALLRALYPEVLPTPSCVWSASSLCLNRSKAQPESTFECIGVRGQPTSRHYNIIIEDDTVAPDFDELGQETLAPSHDDVRKAVAWHSLALPLLTNPSTDEIIVVGTRWYEHDLMSHIERNEPQYETIERSCREDSNGVSDPRGMVTYPERFDADVLAEYETTLGPYFFSTLMLNRPVGIGDMLFRAEWLREYEELPPRQSLHVYTTIDPATDPELSTSRADDLDYSVVMTCGKDMITGDIYVLDYFRERCNPGDMAAAIFEQVLTWRPIVVGYEDVAYQKSLDYWLKELMRQRSQFFILEPIKRVGRKSKETHIMGLQPIAAAGALYLRSWMNDLRTEFLSFPRGAHDDLIDALAMQTQLWKRTRSKREERQGRNLDSPFSLDAAIESIRARNRTGRDNIIFDPSRSASTVFVTSN